jgi:hypothetical protein
VFRIPKKVSVPDNVNWGVVKQLKVIEGEYELFSTDMSIAEGRD